ncbi:tyrosine recombinase XerS [Terrihalobacillus insolitus]|uniref:tyrosine recombinase XerS n=1 Tax=Terrihalobacillus insolitus TaxID=2950438 RepID=UPI00233F905F|nr:tyrosine recombinase XerS [Terrihalobacillus insolitus]MDC3412966.1 tyrosine recombinase XerS [Terrihalobacillus insolitus]
MNPEKKQRYYERVEEKVKELPWYVGEYIDKKRRKLSSASLLNYCHDYNIFFDWLLAEGYFKGSRKEVSLDVLEKLTVQQMEDFLSFLEFKLENSPLTINRKLSALKSLFHYLQNIAETSELEPYITRNVVAKIELNDVKEDPETIANRMEGKMLRGDEYEQFRQFVAHEYGLVNKDNKKLSNFHKKNRERDTAIISLILGSGLRLSEITGLDLDDIDWHKNTVRVIRKGNKEQYVYISDQAALDLKEYLTIRKETYGINKSNKALFVATTMGPKGTSRRLTDRSIEKIVEKYAAAFGKPSLSVHKLRHSFATRYHLENNNVPKLRRQLGHSSIQTTMIYTHLTNDEMHKAVNKADN